MGRVDRRIMPKIWIPSLVTGAAGRVGSRVLPHLSDLRLSHTDRSELDVGDREALFRAFSSHRQVLHLALPSRTPDWTPAALTATLQMADDVLDTARRAGLARVIIPSSTYAGGFPRGPGVRIGAADAGSPSSHWGRTCLDIEERARAAAAAGDLEVVCVRLGAVPRLDHPGQGEERRRWISRQDCADMFRACLTGAIVPGRVSIFYAVSDLPDSPFDTANPFGWAPKTRTPGFRRTARMKLDHLNTSIRGRLQLGTRLRAWRDVPRH